MYSVNQMRHTASAQFKFNSQGYIYHNIQKFCLKKISTSVRPKNTLQIHRDKLEITFKVLVLTIT